MEEGEIIIRGNRVRYTEKKGDNATVYIFLHGWGSDYTLFAPLFEETDSILAFDFPGFGKSAPLQEVWTVTDYAAILQEMLEKKVGERNIIFVAHSFGGRVLLRLLSQQSRISEVQHIICTGVPFMRKQGMKQHCAYLCAKIGAVLLPLLPKNIAKTIKNQWYTLLGAEDYALLENDIMKKTFQKIISTDMHSLTQSLRNYTTHFIWGTHDTEAPIEDAEVIAHEVGATLHRIPYGDHFPFIGDTEKEFTEIFKQITAP